MYIVKSGKLSRYMKGYKLGHLVKGDSLEEYALLSKGTLRRETAVVEEKAELLSFGVHEIESVLGRSLHLILIRNNANKRLLASKYFSFLPEELRDKVLDCFSIRKVEKEEVVIYEGMKKKDLIFFVVEGEYQTANKEKEASIFGEEAFNFDLR